MIDENTTKLYWECENCESNIFEIEIDPEGGLLVCKYCGAIKGYITEFEPWDESL